MRVLTGEMGDISHPVGTSTVLPGTRSSSHPQTTSIF